MKLSTVEVIRMITSPLKYTCTLENVIGEQEI